MVFGRTFMSIRVETVCFLASSIAAFSSSKSLNGVGLAAVSSADCSVIHLVTLPLVDTVGNARLEHILLGADGRIALTYLEVVDAAEGSVIEQHTLILWPV